MTTFGASRIPRLTTDATVLKATEAMAECGIDAALVVDGVGVIGMVTASGLAGGSAEPDRSVLDFMTFEVVRIDPGDDVVTTVRTYQEAGARSVARRLRAQGAVDDFPVAARTCGQTVLTGCQPRRQIGEIADDDVGAVHGARR